MKSKKSVIAVISLAAIFFLVIQSCKHEPLVVPQPQEPVNNGENPFNNGGGGPIYGSSGDTVKDSICFNEEILPLFISNCAIPGCHNASSLNTIKLTNYNQIVGRKNDIVDKITKTNNNDRMPPPPYNPLSQTQINLIKKWIAEGAKNNIDCGMSCDTTIYTYSGAVSLTMQNYCVGCHNGGTAGAGISLIGYSNLLTQVNNGKLWGAINHFNGYYPMPLNGPMLDDCRITTIKKWIAAGAPNN